MARALPVSGLSSISGEETEMTDFKHVEEQIAKIRPGEKSFWYFMDDKRTEIADTMQALLDENRRLRKLLSMWLRVNDWDEEVGGLRWNTIVALTNLQECDK
jgi:hypothetical protein